MDIIAAAVIGGTSMFGGVGSTLGILLGAAVTQMLSNGLVFLGFPSYWQAVAIGALMLLTILLDYWRRQRRKDWLMEPLVRAVNLSKSLGTLSMVKQVSLEIYPGEVLGLAGQSGAGKSALAMLLAGVYEPNEGELYFAGQRLRWPFQARGLGIEIIHQHPEIAEKLDISSNVFLGNEIGWSLAGKWLTVPNRRRMDREAVRILSQLGHAGRFAPRRTWPTSQANSAN